MVAEVAVLVNPIAGRGKASRLVGPVTERLREAGVKAQWEAGRNAEEAADLARRWVSRGVDGILVVGGDGMVHLVLQAVAESQTALGIVAAGTGNDLARALGIPRNDPLAATDLVIADVKRRIDLGKVGSQYFSTVMCAGIDSRIAERVSHMRWIRGRTRYDLATVAELKDFRTQSYVLQLDGEEKQVDALLVAVGNTSSYGGGMRMCEGADPTDGKFDVAVIGALRRRDLVGLFPKLFKGTHVDHPLVELFQAGEVSVATTNTTAYADGERLAPLPVTAKTIPHAVSIYAPPQ